MKLSLQYEFSAGKKRNHRRVFSRQLRSRLLIYISDNDKEWLSQLVQNKDRRKHINSEPPDNVYECSNCDRICKSHVRLLRHKRSCISDKL